MKITKSQLKRIIKEELAKVLKEVSPDDIKIPPMPDEGYDDSPDQAVKLACEDTGRGKNFRNDLRAKVAGEDRVDRVVAEQIMSRSKERCPHIWHGDKTHGGRG
jgi:hypothetical protein